MKTDLTKRNGRVAGLLYLAIIVFGIYGEFFARRQIIDHSSAHVTASHILDNLLLFRSGIISDVICHLCHLFLVLLLYRLLKPFGAKEARLMLSCVVISVTMTFVNLMNSFAAVLLLTNPDVFSEFNSYQLSTLAFFFIKLHGYGYTFAGVFFGLWLIPLGQLVNRSGAFPKILGYLLIAGSLGYLMDTLLVFLYPSLHYLCEVPLMVSMVAELAFCFYLIIVGCKPPKS